MASAADPVVGDGAPPTEALGVKLGRAWERGGVLVPLLVLFITFAGINSRFLSVGNLKGIVEQNVIILVLAVGTTFVLLIGSLDLSIEGVSALAGVVTGLLVANDLNSNDFGFGAVVLAVLIGLAFGLLNGALNVYLRLPSFVVTLGTWFVALGLSVVLHSHYALGGGRITDTTIRELAFQTIDGFSGLTFVAVAVIIVGYVFQKYTLIGRRLYAVGGNEAVASLSGIDVARARIAAFAMSGALAGLAGAMTLARFGGLASGISTGETLFAVITAVVIGGTALAGGRGGVLHTVVGVATLGVLANGMALSGIPPFYQQAVQGGLILIALAFGAFQWGVRGRDRLRLVK